MIRADLVEKYAEDRARWLSELFEAGARRGSPFPTWAAARAWGQTHNQAHTRLKQLERNGVLTSLIVGGLRSWTIVGKES